MKAAKRKRAAGKLAPPRPVTVAELLTGRIKVTCGDWLLLSGTLYTARDQAHQRLAALVRAKRKLPLDLNNSVLYYCGPSAARGAEFGACGPTTASRMDPFMAALFAAGHRISIGKGQRSPAVQKLLRRKKGMYLSALGGLGALYAQCVTAWEPVAFPDLGPEAMLKLTVRDFPVIVVNA